MSAPAAGPPGPHQGQPVRMGGQAPGTARAAILALHGRGARAEDILALTAGLPLAGVAVFAPQAAGDTWYPNRFLEPLASNEPWLSSALAFVAETLARIAQSGIPPQRTLLLGFSQGACLALEFAARLLGRTWAGRKLAGFRSLPPADRPAVIDALARLAQLAVDCPTIAEIEINPLRALPTHQGAVAIDVRVRLG